MAGASRHVLMFSAAVKRLPSLPPEVVHKVLGDIQLVRIVHMVCAHDIPYLDGCVVSHGDIGKVLPAARLSEIKQFFTLYLDIIKLHRSPALRRPHIAPLECDAQTFVGKGGTVDGVIYHITSAILIKLSQYDPFHEALQPHASGPIPSLYHVDTTDVGSLRHLFEMLNGAEEAMNKKKSEQLKRVAQLMAKYPQTLKMAKDVSQEERCNEQHEIDHLLRLSKRMLQAQILDRKFVAVRFFAGHGLFVVPYDRCGMHILLSLLIQAYWLQAAAQVSEDAETTSRSQTGSCGGGTGDGAHLCTGRRSAVPTHKAHCVCAGACAGVATAKIQYRLRGTGVFECTETDTTCGRAGDGMGGGVSSGDF